MSFLPYVFGCIVWNIFLYLFYCLVGGFTQTNNSQDITPVVVLYKNSVVDNFELRRGVLEKAVCG